MNPRTAATQAAYNEFKKGSSDPEFNQTFDFKKEKIIKEFNHWYIIKNRFPYDTMVRINDMLVSKRAVGSFADLTEDEHAEYHKIIEQLTIDGAYDARIENFPKVQSVKKHIHIHLVCWHNTNS